MPAILLTRPADAAARFAEKLRARLGDVPIVISPLLRIEWRQAPLPGGTPIFTSPNGVEGFLRAGGVARGACWCVGEATARAARAAGFAARASGGDAAALTADILASGETGPFAHLRGVHIAADLAATLRESGCVVEEAVVYDQIAQNLSDEALALLNGGNPVVLPLFSPRTAGQFAREHRGAAPLFVATMSAAVSKALGPFEPVRICQAARPDAAAMADAAERLFAAALHLEGEGAAK